MSFMYGDIDATDPIIEPQIITVLLIGFDGRRKVLTGTQAELWREFLAGDGGPGNKLTTKPCGWEYWCRQPLGTPDQEACCSHSIETLKSKKDQ